MVQSIPKEQTPEVHGPDALGTELERLVQMVKDNNLPDAQHYLLYRQGRQKSLIRIDVSPTSTPQIWFYDLDGRPAPNNIKEVIARITPHFSDESLKAARERNNDFLYRSGIFQPLRINHSLKEAREFLQAQKPIQTTTVRPK